MRHAADALLTGIGTVLSDDPRLTDRTGLPRRRKLLRAIVDSRLRLPLRSKLVKFAESDVVLFTLASAHSAKAQLLEQAGIEVFRVRPRGGHVDLREVIRELGRRQILNVLLEAGAALNGAALLAGIVDKMVLFYAPRIMGTGGVPLAQIAAGRLRAAPSLSNLRLRAFGLDFAIEGYLRDVYRNYRTRRKN
jgi:diaminohydroxyphosphoribosylaminopyrimidine deaminase / 5-amino-6-(5-phosphoribosylamino)uracil reductase